MGFATDWTKLDAVGRDRVKQTIADYETIRDYLNKDYYPLFPQSTDATQWVGWEFFDPAAREGFLTVLRPSQSTVQSAAVRLGGVEIGEMYEFSRLDGSQVGKSPAANCWRDGLFRLTPVAPKCCGFRS